jgi:hypothetical protein
MNRMPAERCSVRLDYFTHQTTADTTTVRMKRTMIVESRRGGDETGKCTCPGKSLEVVHFFRIET